MGCGMAKQSHQRDADANKFSISKHEQRYKDECKTMDSYNNNEEDINDDSEVFKREVRVFFYTI